MAVLRTPTQEQNDALRGILARELGVDPSRVLLDSFCMESAFSGEAIIRVESAKVVSLDVVNEILRAGA